MCSERQRELYIQYEPEANEVVFGQRTAPDRPLTDKEVSLRKKIILKLIDQQLKFELIELMTRQQTNEMNSSSDRTNVCTVPSNQHHQPAVTYHQQCEIPRPNFYDFRPNFHFYKPFQSEIRIPLTRSQREKEEPRRNQTNPNLINLSIESTTNSDTESGTSTIVRATASKGISSTSEKISATQTSPQKLTDTLEEPQCNQRQSQNSSEQNPNWPQQEGSQCQQNQKTNLSNSDAVRSTNNSTFTDSEPTTESSSRKCIKRKPEHCLSSDSLQKKIFLDNEPIIANYTSNADVASITVGTSVVETGNVAVNTIQSQCSIGPTSDNVNVEKRSTNSASNQSNEWNAMDQLVMKLFRKKSTNPKQLTPSERQLKNEILIQMSFNPNAIDCNTDAQKVRKKVGYKKFDAFVKECRVIMTNLRLSSPENQASFTESQSKLLEEMKELKVLRDTLNMTLPFRGVNSKITSLISPFLCAGKNWQNLVNELIKNPHALQSNETLKHGIIAKGQSIEDIMKSIKDILDEFIPVRLPKKFHISAGRFLDVPFVVNLYDRSLEMTEGSATELTKVLFNSIQCLKSDPKPSIRDIKFEGGSLKILCLNSMSFDWLENTISDHLGVDVCPVKNVITMNELKTIRLTFERPQYLHFNNLMEQLKVDNPRLLTRRWELRSPQFVDASHDGMYVGVDVESLIVLEEMQRVGTL